MRQNGFGAVQKVGGSSVRTSAHLKPGGASLSGLVQCLAGVGFITSIAARISPMAASAQIPQKVKALTVINSGSPSASIVAEAGGGAAASEARRAADRAKLQTPPDGNHGGYISGAKKHD